MDEEELDERMHEGLYERPNNGFPARGSIEVIVGSMFSGKTEELTGCSRCTPSASPVVPRPSTPTAWPLTGSRCSWGQRRSTSPSVAIVISSVSIAYEYIHKD